MGDYIYDGSFEGLLTVIYEIYYKKILPNKIDRNDLSQKTLFGENIDVLTDPIKAAKVWDGLLKRISASARNNLYKAFLSEMTGIEMLLYNYIKLCFESTQNIEQNYGNLYVLKVHEQTKKINREVHRMHAFVRFEKTKDNIYYASVKPDFNVIPLIGTHFEKRYADQQWLIFDTKRKYGIFYDLTKLEEVKFEVSDRPELEYLSRKIFSEKESLYQILWKNYFNSVNIPERKNLKLHLRHMPRRYWEYLVEKN